ncbi:MAG: hypothetical protein AB7U81_02680 [Thiohalomonadaceae bacterium]
MNQHPREPGETSFPDIEEVDEQWKDPDDPDLFLREATCDDEPSKIAVGEEKRQETGASP